ncbi:MAG TPA: SH3 domain-containing protein [Devosia sp.]|nr:SH3 domain-containing protein [Devosia sp.]
MAQLRLALWRDNPLFWRDSPLFRASIIIMTFLMLVTAVTFFMPRQFADAATGTTKPALVTAPWSTPQKATPPKDLVTATFDALTPELGKVPAKRIVQTLAVSPSGTLPDSIAAPAPLAPEVVAEAEPVASSEPLTVASADPVVTVPEIASDPNTLIATESVNVRSGPGKSSGRVFVLEAGASVTVSETSKGWLHITDGDDRDGWAYGESFDAQAVEALTVPEATDVAVATATDVAPPPADTAKVLGQGVTVRSGPGKSNGALFALAGGTSVTVLENQKGWLKITDPKGRTGWAYKDFLSRS